MKAASRNIKKLFQSDVRFLVPMYQRPYVWTEKNQWKPLFDDVVHLVERYLAEREHGVINGNAPEERTPHHFLGALVVDQEGSIVGEIDRRLVIDGQQRLTTLQLLLSVVKTKAEALGDSRLAAQLRSLVENAEEYVDPAHPEERWKVWPTNSDRQAFVEVMTRSDGRGDSRFASAWRFFSGALDEWVLGDGEEHASDRLKALVAMLQSHLEVVAVELEAGDNAQVIFETLNDRGVALLAADLVKNYVFQHLEPATNADQLYDQRWKSFDLAWWREEVRQGRLKRPRIDVFLQHWLVLRTESDVLATELFTTFKAMHKGSGRTVENLLEELHEDSGAFERLDAVAREQPDSIEGTFVYRWRILENTAFTPVVMRLFASTVGVADRQRGLKALESWMVRRALCGSTAKDINRFALDLVTWLAKSDLEPGEQLERLLLDAKNETRRWPSDAEVTWQLTTFASYGRLVQRRLAMILGAIEDDIRKERHAEQSAPKGAALEIEHVMPVGWRTYWRAGPMSEPEVQRRDQRIHELGNLTLVTGKVNKLLTNHPWTEAQAVAADAPIPPHTSLRGKRNVLAQYSTFLLNADLAAMNAEVWDEASISGRTTEMITRVLHVWPREDPSGLVPEWEPPASRFDASSTAAPNEATSRRFFGRSLENIVDGTEVSLRGVTGVVRGGRLVVNGIVHPTPTSAAVAAGSGAQLNGWQVWKTRDGGSLADLHDRLTGTNTDS